MSFDPITAVFDIGKTVIEKIWPDPVQQAQELRKLEELRQTGDLARLQAHVQIMTNQMEINKVEAQHKSLFVAGWRPFVGWVGGTALAYQFVLYPLMLWVWHIVEFKYGIPKGVTPPPVLDTSALYTVLMGMLGIGAMRSYDKKNGVETNTL